MWKHGCMPSLKFNTALKPFDLIKSIEAASQTGLVHEGLYNSEAVLQDIDRCAPVDIACALQHSSFILWFTSQPTCVLSFYSGKTWYLSSSLHLFHDYYSY